MNIRYFGASFVLMLALPMCVLAQANRERTTVQAKGELKAVANGAIQVVGEDGEQWVVKVDPRSQYNVFQGSAELRFLRPGMFVEFRNSFDRKGKPQEEVRELKVFSPRQDSRLGLIPVTGGLNSGGLFSDTGDEDKKKKKTPPPEILPLMVSGPIRAIKDNKISVVAGGTQLTVELADKVQIAFNLADFSMVSVGDTVEVNGWAYPEQPNLVMASRLTVTAAKPLGLVEDKSKKKPAKAPDLNSLDDF